MWPRTLFYFAKVQSGGKWLERGLIQRGKWFLTATAQFSNGISGRLGLEYADYLIWVMTWGLAVVMFRFC